VDIPPVYLYGQLDIDGIDEVIQKQVSLPGFINKMEGPRSYKSTSKQVREKDIEKIQEKIIK
jgi:hypothetical protein